MKINFEGAFKAGLVNLLAVLAFGQNLGAQVVWDGSGDLDWSQPDATSWTGATFNAGDAAQFTNAGAGIVTVQAGGVTSGNISVNSTFAYNFTGGAIGGTGGLTKTGTGTLTISNQNTYTGATVVNGGSLDLNAAGPTIMGNLTMNGPAVTLTRTQKANQFGSGVVVDMTAAFGSWNELYFLAMIRQLPESRRVHGELLVVE